MPTFSQSLEQSLHRALAIANERHHQYATLEHLLLSLIDDSDAAAGNAAQSRMYRAVVYHDDFKIEKRLTFQRTEALLESFVRRQGRNNHRHHRWKT